MTKLDIDAKIREAVWIVAPVGEDAQTIIIENLKQLLRDFAEEVRPTTIDRYNHLAIGEATYGDSEYDSRSVYHGRQEAIDEYETKVKEVLE